MGPRALIDGSLRIAPFTAADQTRARALVLAGMVEHWGTLDESLNPDLIDIAGTYAAGVFLCAWSDNELVGTGALKRHADGSAEIVRMSVARAWRRRGVGRAIVSALLDQARVRGHRRIILETTETWDDAVRFYLSLGFTITHRLNGEVYFVLEL